jgi:kumamolisin
VTVTSRIVRPRAAATRSLPVRDVARAYNYPIDRFTGAGAKVGIIELGGGFSQADLTAYFGGLGLPVPQVTSKNVAGGQNKSDGPDGADGEVLLDIEVVGAVAPGAQIVVYFCPNTDAGFLAGIKAALADGCDACSISWGAAESEWDLATMRSYDQVFAQARAAGMIVTVASGDTGSSDGEADGKPHTDFPASSPNVIACGGTELAVDGSGARASEVTWDIDDRQSATGGGVSVAFPGRNVPDVAGNASPNSGYEVRVDGGDYVIGGTSAVAPLYAGLVALLTEALGEGLGKKVDFLNTIVTNPGVCFDVTVGDNGAYRAGIGRDQVTGFGVVDGGRLLAVVSNDVPDPAPVPGPGPAPQPTPDPQPTPQPGPAPAPAQLSAKVIAWARRNLSCWKPKRDRQAAEELLREFGVPLK